MSKKELVKNIMLWYNKCEREGLKNECIRKFRNLGCEVYISPELMERTLMYRTKDKLENIIEEISNVYINYFY